MYIYIYIYIYIYVLCNNHVYNYIICDETTSNDMLCNNMILTQGECVGSGGEDDGGLEVLQLLRDLRNTMLLLRSG